MVHFLDGVGIGVHGFSRLRGDELLTFDRGRLNAWLRVHSRPNRFVAIPVRTMMDETRGLRSCRMKRLGLSSTAARLG